MSHSISPAALAVMERSLQLAGLDPEKVGVRLHVVKPLGGGIDVQLEFAEEPHEGDVTHAEPGLQIFLDGKLFDLMQDAVIDVEQPHERIVVRPAP